MDKDFRLILKPHNKQGIDFSSRWGKETAIIDERAEETTVNLLKEWNINSLLFLNLTDFHFLKHLPAVDDIQIIYSYQRRKKLAVDFEPLYNLNLKSFNLGLGKCTLSIAFDCAKLKNLKEFKADFSYISNLHSLKNLESLHLDSIGEIENLSFLENLKDLKYLVLSSGEIKTLDGIENCNNLQSLTLEGVTLLNSSCLQKLPRLKNLCVKGMVMDDISESLQYLTELEYLKLNYNGIINDVFWLKNMHKLQTFILYCKVKNGNLNDCKQIPFAKIAIEYPHYDTKDADLSKNVCGESLYGIPTYKDF